MTSYLHSVADDRLTAFEAQAASLEDPRPYPNEGAVTHVGAAIVTELLDLVSDTALEDHQATIVESVIGAFHSALQRIEREADRARDDAQRLIRDFDGSEVADVELQEATGKAKAGDVAVLALELLRDAAGAAYTTATGDVWTPWKGGTRATRATAAMIEARDVIRGAKQRRLAGNDPGGPIVIFRGTPAGTSQADAMRIFDALNFALESHPGMALATSGAQGAEKIAIRWARQKNVTLIPAKPDFDRDGRSAPFKVNDTLLALDPVLCLTLPMSLAADRHEASKPSGVVLNLAQKAEQAGVRQITIRVR